MTFGRGFRILVETDYWNITSPTKRAQVLFALSTLLSSSWTREALKPAYDFCTKSFMG